MRIVYFGATREAVGIDGEERDFPDGVKSVSDALHWLSGQGPAYAAALSDRTRLRFALDQKMVKADAPLAAASEFAIFPPVTGG
jgi:sulfur-carrier protein